MTAAVEHVQTADSRITAPPPTAKENSPHESGDPAADLVLSGAGETAGLLVVEGRFSIVPEWLLDTDVSDAAVRLYAVLLRFGATSGQRMPSRRTLADRLRKKSVDSVDRAMKELVAIGAVEVSHRSRDGVNLTNRYLVRSTPPGQPAPGRQGRGGRTDAATPADCSRDGQPGASSHQRRNDGRRAWGSRKSAATPGRESAAGVAGRIPAIVATRRRVGR